jgi:hypothetical protein
MSFDGRLDDATLFEGYAASADHALSHPGCRGILDFSKVTDFEVTAGAVGRLAHHSPLLPVEAARILVAPQNLVYGMARMFQMKSGEKRPALQVVRKMEEAYALLGIESPEFTPLG